MKSTFSLSLTMLWMSVLLAVSGIVPSFVLAQDGTGVITGTVINATTEEPLAGVRVTVEGEKFGGVTNPQGKFIIRGVPSGIYSVRAVALGFAPQLQADVVVSSGKPFTVLLRLQEQTIQSETAEVTASYFRGTPDRATSTQLLSAEDIRRAPGVQEDVVRAVALLPGVAVTAAGRNDLIVRGGAPFENLFLVDNLEVPNINHFGTQGSTGGPLSLINIALVRETNFSTGGFGARFGDKLSSVTEITLREGNNERFAGEANLSATGFGLIVEGPLGESGSYLFSVRRSYLDFIFKAAGFGFVPEYWDFQGKIVYRLDNRNSLSFLTIGALNTVTFNNEDDEKREDNSRILSPEQNQYFSGITWKHLFNGGYMNVTLGRTFTAFRSEQFNDANPPQSVFRNYSDEGENTLRADVVVQLDKHSELSFGSISKFASKLQYDALLPGFLRTDENNVERPLTIDTSFTAFRTALYGQWTYRLGERLTVSPNVRLDYYGFLEEKLAVAPRISATYALSEVENINFSAGRYYQAPAFIWLVGDSTNRTNLRPLRADQIVLSYDRLLASDLKFQVEAYYKWYGDYPARVFRPQAVLAPAGFDDVSNDIPFGLEPLSPTGEGVARGIEIFLQKKLAEIPLYGLISLTLNETRFTGIDGIERAGTFDSRFIGNIAAGYRFSPEWEVSAKFRYATGLPTTPYIQTPERAAETGRPIGSLDFARFNEGQRLPDFHGLDIRVDKRWIFAGWQLITYIDVQNIYGRKNVSQIRWSRENQAPELNESIGVLPSIGVNIQF